jgi:competence protein ComGC
MTKYASRSPTNFPAMKSNQPSHPPDPSARAFTLIELIVIVAFTLLLLLTLLPGMNRAKDRSRRIGCASNLKQVGLAFRTFPPYSKDVFPMNLEASKGGSLESTTNGEVFRHFQALSNELSTPYVLVCPADSRPRATNFVYLSNSNVSYFLDLDATASTPGMFLAGDRNLTNGTALSPSRILLLTSNHPAGWTHELHKLTGNVALSDGSVQGITTSTMRQAITPSGETNRLAIP